MSQSYSSLKHRLHPKSFCLIQCVLYYKVYELYFTRLEYSSQLYTCLYLSRFKGIGCDLFFNIGGKLIFSETRPKNFQTIEFFYILRGKLTICDIGD